MNRQALVSPYLKPFMNLHVNLQMNLFHVKVHMEALPDGAQCSDYLAVAQYRLAHAVLMVGLRPTTEPYHMITTH